MERALGGAEIGHVQGHVGVDDADEGDVGKVQTFRDHLRADEDVDLAHAEIAEDFAVERLARHHVGIHTLHAGFRE